MLIQKFATRSKVSTVNISVVGGSNSVIRQGYVKSLNNYLGKITTKPTILKYYSLGGVPSIFGTIQHERYNIAANSDIIFFEYCVNDRHAIEVNQYSLELAGKSLEGFIKKAQKSNPNCIIVILIFGINLECFYNNHCYLSELYELIGKRYNLPVLNLTKLLAEYQEIDYVKSLYDTKDHAHYSRPHGVKVVSQKIVNQLHNLGVIDSLKSTIISTREKFKIADTSEIYPDNFKNLAFLENFETGKFFSSQPRISVYQNTVFREKNFTIYQGMSLDFLLKGRLMAIFIKSDFNDGFFSIDFNSQRIVTSSYSSWVHKIKPQNVINLVTLPLRKFSESQDFSPVSIALCPEYPTEFDLGFNKTIPSKKDPRKWKLSIIGVAYTGEIKSIY
ncbi:SGNH/GDSL hydrolase family protein [Pleurocapsa sp. PCC 7319]|uniref:SGNH/GDSL hydrolase family protein n=1 Tax=Pleurocapsa sp. PCC 7319 TaxID=118161 RepID=UPI000348F111|nr:SGNH/GDSL hydrolase family protein [Pleurocapsa sp. PCC 7319]